MSEEKYLIWSHEHSAWWRPDSCGYCQEVQGAGLYSKEEAESICESANHGVERHEEMRPASDYVDRLLNDSWKEYLFFKPISWLMPKKFSPSNVLRIVNRC